MIFINVPEDVNSPLNFECLYSAIRNLKSAMVVGALNAFTLLRIYALNGDTSYI